jgi:phage terminase small subunit
VKLTAKQERFIEEYMIDLNATQACIRAGYSERNADKIGSELLGKTRVAAAIQEAKEKRRIKAERSAEDVLKDLMELRSKCMRPIYDKEGNETMEAPSVAAKCIELEGKHLGMFSDRLKVEGSLTVTFISEFPND